MMRLRSGERTIPLPPIVVTALREWKLACPKGALDLAFPNGRGNIEIHSNIIHRALLPVQLAAGLTIPATDSEGKTRLDCSTHRRILAQRYAQETNKTTRLKKTPVPTQNSES